VTVVLDSPRASLLVGQVIEKCGSDPLVATVVIRTGGQQMAGKSNTGAGQMARFSLVRELNILAVQGRTDISEVPKDWAERQGAPMAPCPALTGAALRIYTLTGTRQDPNFSLVGVIGLLGVESELAITTLTEVLRGNGFLLFSDLPLAGAQD